MMEIMLVVFVKEKHQDNVGEGQMKSHRDGFLGIVGNKGGIQVSFSLYNKKFNFISGHLVHGQNTVDGRNEMMSGFMQTFKNENGIDLDFICDYNFIFGDLNYRMDSDFK